MTNEISRDAKILIVGDGGVMENGFERNLTRLGFRQVFTSSRLGLDASIQSSVYAFFQDERPHYVILGSALSGGMGMLQTSPADFIYQNCESQNNVIYASWKFGARKLVYLAAPCVYSVLGSSSVGDGGVVNGRLEADVSPYAIAKLAGLKMCAAFRRQYGLNALGVIPATVYGPQRPVDAERSPVLGALLKIMDDALRDQRNEIKFWGTGEARREFLHIDDLAEAVMMFLAKPLDADWINVGSGDIVSIRELAGMIARVAGFSGVITGDLSRPDGESMKPLDSSRVRAMGWAPRVTLIDGIQQCWDHLREDRA